VWYLLGSSFPRRLAGASQTSLCWPHFWQVGFAPRLACASHSIRYYFSVRKSIRFVFALSVPCSGPVVGVAFAMHSPQAAQRSVVHRGRGTAERLAGRHAFAMHSPSPLVAYT
jgi:hypothetical protein